MKSFTDLRDSKIYQTVQIGNQLWLAENLAFRLEENCWTYSNNPKNVKTYGYLYDWEAAQKACPPGWHVPTEAEWTTLITFL